MASDIEMTWETFRRKVRMLAHSMYHERSYQVLQLVEDYLDAQVASNANVTPLQIREDIVTQRSSVRAEIEAIIRYAIPTTIDDPELKDDEVDERMCIGFTFEGPKSAFVAAAGAVAFGVVLAAISGIALAWKQK